jgi:PleD family two-component response regulator
LDDQLREPARVLVVDDKLHSANKLVRALNASGIINSAVFNGDAALKTLSKASSSYFYWAQIWPSRKGHNG